VDARAAISVLKLLVSRRTAEAKDELVQAIALFHRSKMTVHLERAKAALSGFSDL
jgi:hypothetical protein